MSTVPCFRKMAENLPHKLWGDAQQSLGVLHAASLQEAAQEYFDKDQAWHTLKKGNTEIPDHSFLGRLLRS